MTSQQARSLFFSFEVKSPVAIVSNGTRPRRLRSPFKSRRPVYKKDLDLCVYKIANPGVDFKCHPGQSFFAIFVQIADFTWFSPLVFRMSLCNFT